MRNNSKHEIRHKISRVNDTLNQVGIKDTESRVFIRKHFENETAKILAQEEGV